MGSDSCSHNCSGCGEDCGDRSAESLFEKLNEFSCVKKVIGLSAVKAALVKV